MNYLPSSDATVWINVAYFTLAAIGVWYSGTKLSVVVDIVADRTGIGKAFAGALLLGGATSLPEMATTITAATSGATTMAVSNLLGGVTMQICVLALMDWVVLRKRALTFFSPNASLLMHGITLIGMLALAIAAMTIGEIWTIGHVGLWSIFLVVCYVAALWVVYHYEDKSRWEPAGEIAQPPESAMDMKDVQLEKFRGVSLPGLTLRFATAAIGVLIFGTCVALSGEAIAQQTWLGEGFVGAILVALATSLPEVSTTWSAIRFGAYSMAVANILGTNCLEVALLLPADLAYRQDAIIRNVDPSVSFLGALGIVVTTIYLWGILERRDRTILGMGVDSAAVLLIYTLGMLVYSQAS